PASAPLDPDPRSSGRPHRNQTTSTMDVRPPQRRRARVPQRLRLPRRRVCTPWRSQESWPESRMTLARDTGASTAEEFVMGSPIPFSGFNQIDFNVVLNAIMQQESQPLQALQSHQRDLQATDSAFAQLASRLDTLRTAAADLSDSSGAIGLSATSS